MPTLTNTIAGFEFKRLDNNEIAWTTTADASNFSQYAPADVAIIGSKWNVDYGAGAVSTEYTGAWQFSGMTIPGGDEVATATVTIPIERFYKEHRAYIYGVLDADMGAPATNNLPSAQALTTAKVAFCNNSNSAWVSTPPWADQGLVTFTATDTWTPTPQFVTLDIVDILNELSQDASFNNGDPVTLIWIDEENPGQTGYVRVPNLASALGLPPAEITFTTQTIGAGPVEGPTSTPTSLAFVDGDTITVNTTEITTVTSGLVTVNGISQAQTLTPVADQHTFTFNRGILPNGSGTYTFDGDGTEYSHNITVSPDGGMIFVDVVNPNTTEASLLHAVDSAILAGAMQFEWNPTTANGHTLSISSGGVPSITAGTGSDDMFIRFWSAVTGYWDDVFTAEYQDIGYIGSNKVDPIALEVVTNNPIFIAKGGDFYSVNAPSIYIVDGAKEITAYVNRDNTAEFIFFESGAPVDLNLVTDIQLTVGAYTFSSAVGSYTTKFKKDEGGFLEVHMGELGLPVGTYNFYFVLFTSNHTQGVVWNPKEDYTVNVVAD